MLDETHEKLPAKHLRCLTYTARTTSRYVRRCYLSVEAARRIAIEIGNATFGVRRSGLWGKGSTAVASDWTHFGSWDQKMFTEWHSRYGGRGVLIYGSVKDKDSAAIHSQVLNCSASEVHATLEAAIHAASSASRAPGSRRAFYQRIKTRAEASRPRSWTQQPVRP